MSARTRFRVRHSLAARITALVALLVVATGVSSLVILSQLRAQQSSFDLLTGVYVPFNARLAEAHVQDVRISVQIAQFAQSNEQLEEAERLSLPQEVLFTDALSERTRLVLRARRVLDQAFENPGRIGGVAALERLEPLRASMVQLEEAVVGAETRAAIEILRDIRTQHEIDRLLKELEVEASRAIAELQVEVLGTSRRTEQIAITVLLGATLLALAITLGVIWTLRPLQRLAASVRRLGQGDWDHRVAIGQPRKDRFDEVSQLAREFNLMAEALQERERRLIRGERLAAVGQLAAQVTHEIRNPLSSVALNVELLGDEIESPEAAQLLTRITEEIDRLTQITEAYLNFARRPKPERVAMDLSAELHALLDFMAGEHELAEVEVIREIEPEAWVLGDAGQLRQALRNLLRNAREALTDEPNPERGVNRITVRLRHAGDRVIAQVEDNGPGLRLPDADVDRVFEAFFTSKARGTGLGLAIVHQIISDHDGAISLRATGPAGTAFELDLPACDPRAASVSSADARSDA